MIEAPLLILLQKRLEVYDEEKVKIIGLLSH